MIRIPRSAMQPNPRTRLAWMLAARLERLSADSYWAHQASGLRGALLRALDQIERGPIAEKDWARLDELTASGFEILENAAREVIAK
jgi:hypothetical protein